MARALFWLSVVVASCLLIFMFLSATIGTNTAPDRVEIAMSVVLAVLIPPLVWGLYRMILWVAVGPLERNEPNAAPKLKGSVFDPTFWPPFSFMALVGLWTLFAHFLIHDRPSGFIVFQRHPSAETLLYVFAGMAGSHWPASLLAVYAIAQLIRGCWRNSVNSFSFLGLNLLVYGLILANKPVLHYLSPFGR
jgi:hypothetical protein